MGTSKGAHVTTEPAGRERGSCARIPLLFDPPGVFHVKQPAGKGQSIFR